MKLGDIDVNDLINALGMERSAWINILKERNRRLTDAERATICVLAAFEGALRKVVFVQENRKITDEAKQAISIKPHRPFDDAVLDALAKAIDGH